MVGDIKDTPDSASAKAAFWWPLGQLPWPIGDMSIAVRSGVGEAQLAGQVRSAVRWESVIISLLNLPLDLSPDSPACSAGHTGLFTGLAEYVRRCR